MYVCVCNAITDREIRGAAELGARTLEDLSRDAGRGDVLPQVQRLRAQGAGRRRVHGVSVRRRRLNVR